MDITKIKQTGFTLIELLVAVFIIALITGSVLVSYRGGNDQYSLTQAAQILAANVRQAQNKALSGQQQGGTPYGFGVKIASATEYWIFLNSTTMADPKDNYIEGASEIIARINLPAGATVTLPVGSSGSIFYVPPDPITYLDGVAGAGAMTLTVSAGALTKNVVVYPNGKIEIN